MTDLLMSPCSYYYSHGEGSNEKEINVWVEKDSWKKTNRLVVGSVEATNLQKADWLLGKDSGRKERNWGCGFCRNIEKEKLRQIHLEKPNSVVDAQETSHFHCYKYTWETWRKREKHIAHLTRKFGSRESKPSSRSEATLFKYERKMTKIKIRHWQKIACIVWRSFDYEDRIILETLNFYDSSGWFWWGSG